MDAKGQLLPEMKLDIAFCGLISCDTKRVMECRITNRDWACCLVQSQTLGAYLTVYISIVYVRRTIRRFSKSRLQYCRLLQKQFLQCKETRYIRTDPQKTQLDFCF